MRPAVLGRIAVLICGLAAGGGALMPMSPVRVEAAPPCPGTADGEMVADYRSRLFLLHTDVSPTQARSLLVRLESLVHQIARYWGRPLRDPIECYVVDDLSHWPPGALPNPLARVLLERVGGGTDLHKADGTGCSPVKARVYATSERGVVDHEVVHAFCCQTFGTSGPDWYKEGMAQMACYQVAGQGGVHCPADVIRFLRASPTPNLVDVVDGKCFTAPLAASFARLAESHRARSGGRPRARPETWRPRDEAALCTAKAFYHRSWALCHLLCSHPAYRDRFRTLGRGLLSGQSAGFEQAFAAVQDQLAFEFDIFVAHCDQGYRVDLCRWDWDRQFEPLDGDRCTSVQIKAARGYQASGALVCAGQLYAFSSTGTWKTASARASTTADGDRHGRGRLVGVVLHRYELSQPFSLGGNGTFVAPSGGQLYLRCRDAWHELADNTGLVTVRLRRNAAAAPPAPSARASL